MIKLIRVDTAFDMKYKENEINKLIEEGWRIKSEYSEGRYITFVMFK